MRKDRRSLDLPACVLRKHLARFMTRQEETAPKDRFNPYHIFNWFHRHNISVQCKANQLIWCIVRLTLDQSERPLGQAGQNPPVGCDDWQWRCANNNDHSTWYTM